MIDLLLPSTIMRSKFKKLFKFSKLHLWLIFSLNISHLCIKTFDLMIPLAANTSIMRSKFPINDSFFNFDLMMDLLAARSFMRSKL
jgi:hypothetical protein